MAYLLAITTVVGLWAFLSLMGSERDRRSRELDYKIARATAQAALAGQAATDPNARPESGPGR